MSTVKKKSWGSETQSVRLWGKSLSDRTVPPSAEEMLQNTPVQRLRGGNPTTGIPSGRLVTRPRELNITFKLQCKANRTANFTN